ncbi:hypothetical protein [Azospirillum sp.]|uniref:hypothetical protein n=1 Tax=Azospirillum sp. TaxID=34012 RepID=UPI002D2388C4|nr:hypothetical protein [Azospirillum sp.]HYF89781.1 hypothetical protein [Azospirillum sp.]
MAAFTRLFDLHGTRRDADGDGVIKPPAVPEGAGTRLWTALQLLAQLYGRALEGSTGRVPLEALLADLQASAQGMTQADLEFCAAFLAAEREVRYVDPSSLPALEERETRAPTPLVRFYKREQEVKLTENGRLVMRVLSLQRDWLLGDKDVERVVAAIDRGLFEEVPRICAEVIGELRALNEHLTEIEESPTFEAQRAAFERREPQYREMLRRSEEAARQAIGRFGDASTAERFAAWQAENPDHDLTLSDLLSHAENVLRAVESLSRHWLRFLRELQSRRRRPLGVVDFGALADALVDDAPETDFLRNLIASMGPWRRTHLFSPALLDTADLDERAPEQGAVEFDQTGTVAAEEFRTFLGRNGARIVERLRRGPLTLSVLLAEAQADEDAFELADGVGLADLFGVFTIPDEMGEDVAVRVGLSGARFRFLDGDRLLHGDDPVIQLCEEVSGDA